MALFDLGDQLQVSRTVKAAAPEAYALAREVLRSYAASGYRVRFTDEQPPLSLAAEVSDRDGTRIGAAVSIRKVAGGSELSIQLLGKVFVGGVKALVATEPMVRQVARERLEELLEEKLAGLAPQPAKEPAAKEPAAKEPAAKEPAAKREPAAREPPHRHRDPLGTSLDPEAVLQDVLGELTSLAGAAAAGVRAVLGPEPRRAASPAGPRSPAAPSLKEKLLELQEAHAAGAITDEELRRKREELLKAL